MGPLLEAAVEPLPNVCMDDVVGCSGAKVGGGESAAVPAAENDDAAVVRGTVGVESNNEASNRAEGTGRAPNRPDGAVIEDGARAGCSVGCEGVK